MFFGMWGGNASAGGEGLEEEEGGKGQERLSWSSHPLRAFMLRVVAQLGELVGYLHLWLLGLWLSLPWPKSATFLFSLAFNWLPVSFIRTLVPTPASSYGHSS
jgi:hypothetical protein